MHTCGNPAVVSISSVLKILSGLTLFASLLCITSCSKSIEKENDNQPVRVVRVAPSNLNLSFDYVGDVRSRINTKLGFRISGKIVARKVEVGSLIKKGQVLMQLDPTDQQLIQSQTLAAMRSSETNRDLALSELRRYRLLFSKNFISQAQLDVREVNFINAESSFEQAKSSNLVQSNQTSYTTLAAAADGVVTGIDAEVGQVVTAGMPVLQIADPASMEIVVAIPEDMIYRLSLFDDIKIRLSSRPNLLTAGKVREISPIADPATRTFTVKVAIPEQPEEMHLGMTAQVNFASKTPSSRITLPFSALLPYQNKSAVWVVEHNKLKLTPVETGAIVGNAVIVTNGITEGQAVVTAGVSTLKPGQMVMPLKNTAGGKDNEGVQ